MGLSCYGVQKIVEFERPSKRAVKVNVLSVMWSGNCFHVTSKAWEVFTVKKWFFEIVDKVVSNEKVLVGDNVNGCVGIEAGGSGEVHGGYCICQVNDVGVRLMDCVKL